MALRSSGSGRGSHARRSRAKPHGVRPGSAAGVAGHGEFVLGVVGEEVGGLDRVALAAVDGHRDAGTGADDGGVGVLGEGVDGLRAQSRAQARRVCQDVRGAGVAFLDEKVDRGAGAAVSGTGGAGGPVGQDAGQARGAFTGAGAGRRGVAVGGGL